MKTLLFKYRTIKALAALCATCLLFCGQAGAAPSACPAQYAQGQRPDFLNRRLAVGAVELCNAAYATEYSELARAPLWSAEFLTAGRIAQARGQRRANDFREDTRVPSEGRDTLADFRHSGFDRGHMAPAGDMPTPAADSQSFLLTNMIAQNPNLNRELWRAIETGVRAMAMHRDIYVITGPLFEGARIARLDGRVMIPTSVYKLVYDPARNEAAAWIVPNAARQRPDIVSLSELEQRAGIAFLPGVKNVGMLKLPRPRF